MIYSIWLEPSREDARHLSKIIKQLGKKHNAPVFAPHITLYSEVTRYSQARLATDACAGFVKLRIKTLDVRFSNYLWKTLFINIKKDENLKKINKTLRKSLGNINYKFSPHISLIYKHLDNRTKKQMSNDLKIRQFYTFDKITIIKSSKTVSSWKKQRITHLKKSPSR